MSCWIITWDGVFERLAVVCFVSRGTETEYWYLMWFNGKQFDVSKEGTASIPGTESKANRKETGHSSETFLSFKLIVAQLMKEFPAIMESEVSNRIQNRLPLFHSVIWFSSSLILSSYQMWCLYFMFLTNYVKPYEYRRHVICCFEETVNTWTLAYNSANMSTVCVVKPAVVLEIAQHIYYWQFAHSRVIKSKQPVAWVRERPTERPPLVGDVSANFWGQRAVA
jgi:hypothetical protein